MTTWDEYEKKLLLSTCILLNTPMILYFAFCDTILCQIEECFWMRLTFKSLHFK